MCKSPEMDGILDDSRLDGVVDIGTALRPTRIAELLRCADSDKFYERVEYNCQVWGGSGTVFVPSTDGTLTDPYRSELIRSDVDTLEVKAFSEDLKAPHWINHGIRRPHAVLLVAQGMKERDDWHPIRVPVLAGGDPWKPIYAAALGLWPEVPSPDLFPHPFYDAPPESFERFFKVERAAVTGSLDDLVDRLIGSNSNCPRRLTLLGLAAGSKPNTSYIATKRPLPEKNETRWAAGPNIIVVFGDDQVADGALLWNLRGAHASGYALPIGIPRAEVGRATLAKLRKPGLVAAFGFSGGRTFLTSASVPMDELAALASLEPGHVAAPIGDLMQFGQAPAIPRNQLATFSDGIARLVPETESDIKLIFPFQRNALGPDLVLDVVVDNHPLPMSKTMRGQRFSGHRFAAGHAQLAVPSFSSRWSRSVEVEWPTPWLRLQCAARDHDLDVEISESGHAALALVDALGGVEEIAWLAHPGLVRLLYKLAERSGMTWWKGRWKDARRAIDELAVDSSAFDAVARAMGRDEPAVAPSGEGRAIRFQEFVATFGMERAAANWIRWAERRHLVVRGAEVRCDKCRAKSWLPMAAMPATVVCPGCGRPIDHPFLPRQLEFTYRLGEVLRRALEVDCLDHLFALRYFHQYFDRGRLVGVHPGVNFMKRGTTKVCGEADVLLLFPDASLVPGEVKRTGAGVTPDEITKLDTLVHLLQSPWSFIALGQPARECGSNVAAATDRDRTSPRIVVSTDQTYRDRLHYGIGDDPFAWSPMSQDDEDARAKRFVTYLRRRAPDHPWSSQGSSLLAETGETDESES